MEYTFTLNAKREAALTRIVDRVNTRRAAMNPPKTELTNTQYLLGRVKDVAESFVHEMDQEDEVSIREAYKNVDAATKASIKTSLGIQ